MGKGIFITGTGTDVGKTYVTALIVKKLREAGKNAGYYKAAISGAEKGSDGTLLPGDAIYVNKVAGIGERLDRLVSYSYYEAVSPHLAARINERPINFHKVRRDYEEALNKYDLLTVEGSGGIICPLRWDDKQHMIIDDLVCQLKLGAIVVADAGLGTINSAVLTLEHLYLRHIPCRGVILNNWHPGNMMEEDNRRMIEELAGVKVIATVEPGATELDMDPEYLASLYA